MLHRPIHRAAVAALALSLLAASASVADTVQGDADALQWGVQASRDLGEVGPGALVPIGIRFELVCGTTHHVDPGQAVVVSIGSMSVPSGGNLAMEAVTVGPTPADWPRDGTSCPSPAPRVSATGTLTVTAPATVGTHDYSVLFARGLSPSGANDPFAIGGMTALSFALTVVPNTPPVLALPADMTVEGNATGGATAAYTVSATDAEDDPAPSPVCSPASGSLLPLGSTLIECTVTDSRGLSDAGRFTITVVDTTAPSLVGVPGATEATATDASGATVAYPPPTAMDVVDDDPALDCAPAPGSTFPVGTTTVTCTATDDSGNSAQASFAVTVRPATEYRVVFREPVGTGGGLTANTGRTVPVRAEIWRDGARLTDGGPRLVVSDCETREALRSLALAWHPDANRWAGLLDTSDLGSGCRRVAVVVDEVDAGAFTLRLATDGGAAAARGSGRG